MSMCSALSSNLVFPAPAILMSSCVPRYLPQFPCAVARLQQKDGVSHKNLVQMLHCCWEGEMMIVLPFYELGSLRAILGEDRWIKNTERLTWSKDGTLLKLAIGIASGMEFLHTFSSPFPEGSPCAEPGCTKAANLGPVGGKTADCAIPTPRPTTCTAERRRCTPAT